MSPRAEPEERRKNSGLSEDEIESIKERVLASVYADIGRSLVRKILWVGGTALLAVLAWLGGGGHLK